jgi:GTP-binding protein
MDVKFVKSTNDYKKCPEINLPEFGFIGRSNVGKSSLINMITDQKNLARTSATPGKTRLINFFHATYKVKKNDEVKETIQWSIADLPGYGYANVSKVQKQEFEKLISGYILTRKNLMNLFVLIDSRLDPQPIDLAFINFLGEHQVPFVIVFTKSDKISQSQLNHNIEQFKLAMLESWESLPPYFITSAIKKQGKEQLIEYIVNTVKTY